MSDEMPVERIVARKLEELADAADGFGEELQEIANDINLLGSDIQSLIRYLRRAESRAECGDDLARARGELKRAKKDFDAAAAARDELARLLHEAEKREGASGSWDVAADSTTPRGMLLAALDRIAEVTGVMVRRVEVEWATDVVRGKKVPDFTLTRGY